MPRCTNRADKNSNTITLVTKIMLIPKCALGHQPLNLPPPSLSRQAPPPPLNLQTVQGPPTPTPYLGNSPVYCFFVNPPPLKLGFFSELL